MALFSRARLLSKATVVTPKPAAFSNLADRFYNEEQKKLKETTLKIIETEINPFADQVRHPF
jgi:hypothetical protein